MPRGSPRTPAKPGRRDPAQIFLRPRIPTISARLQALTTEYGRRLAEVEKSVGTPNPGDFAPENPGAVRSIRQLARNLDATLDQMVGIVADPLNTAIVPIQLPRRPHHPLADAPGRVS